MTQYINIFSGRQFVDANGIPYSGAKLFVYEAGTSTKYIVTKDKAGASNHANPIILNTKGEPADGAGAAHAIWQTGGQEVKFVLAPSTDTDPPLSTIDTWDNIPGVNDTTIAVTQWILGPTPTYVSPTQFTLIGDQTSTFHVGRRIRAMVSGGTVYGTITVSAYTTLTTITIVYDSVPLDSGISNVYYGVLTATGTTIPGVSINGTTWTHQGTVTHQQAVTHQGTVTLTAKAINLAKGAAVTSAATCNIWTPADGNTVHITGSAGPITSFGTAPQAGAVRWIIFDGAPSVTHNGTSINILNGGSSVTVSSGDVFRVYADTTTKLDIIHFKASGLPATLETRFQAFTTAGTFTNGFTAPATTVWLDIVGGGGGGAGEDASADGGSGGGPGAGIRGFLVNGLTVGATYDVVVGAGGAAGSVTAAGSAGGPSSFSVGGGGSTFISCGGGGGGAAGGGAAGTNGTTTQAGSVYIAATVGSASLGGDGGGSIFGPGPAGSGSTPGNPGVYHGTGGGGGFNSGGAAAGGPGKDGAVIIHW